MEAKYTAQLTINNVILIRPIPIVVMFNIQGRINWLDLVTLRVPTFCWGLCTVISDVRYQFSDPSFFTGPVSHSRFFIYYLDASQKCRS